MKPVAAATTQGDWGLTHCDLRSPLILFGVSRFVDILLLSPLTVSDERQDSATEPAVEAFLMASISPVCNDPAFL